MLANLNIFDTAAQKIRSEILNIQLNPIPDDAEKDDAEEFERERTNHLRQAPMIVVGKMMNMK